MPGAPLLQGGREALWGSRQAASLPGLARGWLDWPASASTPNPRGSENPKLFTTILAPFVVFILAALNTQNFRCRNIKVFETRIVPWTSLVTSLPHSMYTEL